MSKRTLSMLRSPHAGAVGYLSFCATGRLLLSVGVEPEHTITVWRWQEGQNDSDKPGLVHTTILLELLPCTCTDTTTPRMHCCGFVQPTFNHDFNSPVLG